ncbi:pentatricopeptide repeat-containing protein At2g04860 isoform X1 [Juglans regia]|uniref:Pentatricopeptide repeat-containing protein At2g04860 isoform X1 n=2 Tax=Juglans regia TaxID=51240 RepID=A0A6P9EW62_JUGRE|nr:pentatricopeptide repeat-containing protein At2g04860 isoform X1 [Juglans regia]
MRDRDVVTWNVLVCGYSRNGYDSDTLGCLIRTAHVRSMNLSYSVNLLKRPNLSLFHSVFKSLVESKNSGQALGLFRQLLQSNVKPNDLTFSLLLKACRSSTSSSALNSPNQKIQANQIQTHLVRLGFDQFVYVSTAFLDLCMKLGCIKNAQNSFDYMRDRDVVTWNVLICGYSRNGYDSDALELFVQMLREGFSPCQTTLVSLVPSCGQHELVFQGKSIHGFGIKAGLDLDSQVKNVLTYMYSKCADLEAAELLFEEMVERNVVSWNTMIGAYGQNCYFDDAMLVFKQMLEESVEANSVTIMSLLSANAHPESIHCYAIKTGVVNDSSVITTLVCVYARYMNTEFAELLYESFPQKNLVSLTAIISSHAEKGKIDLVVGCFNQMQQLEMKMDAVAMVSILHGITHPAHLGIGLTFHGYGLKIGLSDNNLVANGLISMYSNFDDIEAVFSLFFEMREKTLISWNSVISGCVQAGRPSDAMELFCQMKRFDHSPDAITIASLLSGCCQLGYLQFGERLHTYVLRNNLEVEDFVGTALIDMYTKCGRIECAEWVFKSIKEPCLATWNAIISGYSLYGLEHKALGCYSEMQVQGLKPDKITFLGILAACTHGGLVDEGRRYFKIMREKLGMVPGLQHYACMVGLLARAGLFEEAMDCVKDMEIKPDSAVWGALLSAACIHQEVRLGECFAKKLLFLDCSNGGFFVLMSNLYAMKGRWDDVARMRDMIRDNGGDGCSGVSIIEMTSFEDMNRNLCLSKVNLNTKFLAA